MASIPLICSICPKKPRFSDVSHLLTHIASKGHLSHHYRVNVRAATEEESRRLLEAYDHWYEKWRVHDLMSERMNLKDRRRARAARNQTPHSRAHSVSKRPQNRQGIPASQVNSVDPRLGDGQSRAGSPTTHPYYLHYPSITPVHNGPPGLAPYSSHSHASLPTRARIDNYDGQGSELSFGSKSREPTTHESNIEPDGFEVSEATRLKGVYWPGMDLFDSATPEMKRKRNQKKDTSVIKQLEASSLDVEPSEMVFTPDGTFKKTRNISGDPSDDTDDEWQSDGSTQADSAHKAGPSQTREPLAPLHFGAGRRDGGRHEVFNGTSGVNPSTLADDRAEWDLAYGQPRKRKRGFEIFQDRDGSLKSPPGLNILTSEFHGTSCEGSMMNGTTPSAHRGDQKSALNGNYLLENFHDEVGTVNQENRLVHSEAKSNNWAQQLQEAASSSYKLSLHDLPKFGPRVVDTSGNLNSQGLGPARQDSLYGFTPRNPDFPPFDTVSHQTWMNQTAYYNPPLAFDGEFDDARTISAPPSEHKGED